MKKLLTICVVLFSLGGIIGSTVAEAHSGRTDRNGCHMDRKTGTRHCH